MKICRTSFTCLFMHRYIQQLHIQVCFSTLWTLRALKNGPKNVFPKFLSYFMYKLNKILYKCFSNKILLHRYASPNFWILSPHHDGVHVSLDCPYINIMKMVCQKNVWMQHCSVADWEGRIKDSLKGIGSKNGGLF